MSISIWPTQAIEELATRLEADSGLAQALQYCVGQVLGGEHYDSWLRFEAGHETPWSVIGLFQPEFEFLHELGITGDDGRLRCKFGQAGSSVLLTDGPWVDKTIRVFPYTDESSRLVDSVRELGLFRWADRIVDPACGAGTHRLWFPPDVTSLSLDVNPRAVAYARINQAVNTLPGTVAVGDINSGLPDFDDDDRTLVMFNMPFALAPMPEVLPLTSDGGRTGAKLTFAALSAARDFAAKRSPLSTAIAFVCYSVGNPETCQWEVIDKTLDLFPDRRVMFNVHADAALWRINGRKVHRNPMPVECLKDKAQCQFDVKGNREEVALQYDNLAGELRRNGHTHVGYMSVVVL